jgi:hypothetical protein
MRVYTTITLLTVVSFGCSSGKRNPNWHNMRIDLDRVSDIHVGKTTRSEIEEMFGQPHAYVTRSGERLTSANDFERSHWLHPDYTYHYRVVYLNVSSNLRQTAKVISVGPSKPV